MIRRIIQIVPLPETPDGVETLYALCDDGTVWWFQRGVEVKWRRAPDIPQDQL